MNGEFSEFGEYGTYGVPVSPSANGSSLVSDFFDSARARLSSILPTSTSYPGSGPTLGNQLFEAIYQFGAGKIDAAREKAVGAFLMTSEGKRVQAEGTRQTLNAYLPYILIGVIALLGLGFIAARR